MTHQERVQILFGEPQRKKVYENLSQIINHFSTKTDKVTFDVREVEFEETPKRIKDPTYLDDELLTFTETGIKILDITPEITELLRPYIPRQVKELMLPSTFFNDITFLDEFPNVETLIIPDYATFSKEEMDYIVKHTKIKTIEFRSINGINDHENTPGFCRIKAGNTIAKYDRLTLFCKGYKGEWKKSLEAYTTECSKENLENLEKLYTKIEPFLPPLTSAKLIVNKDEKMTAIIDNGTVEEIKAKSLTPTEFTNMYKLISKRTTPKNSVYVGENKTYKDIDQLRVINATSNLKVNYQSINASSHTEATYDEFMNMRATIDYYKEIIEEANLSPVEQIAYVYDILKTMRYQENKEQKERSRDIHAIVTDGQIVCQGYATFAKQLLLELGIKCINVGVTCPREKGETEFHARNFVRVDDDKYNIHGIYALDITWDSDRDVALIEEDGEKSIIQHPEPTDNVLYQYDSLVLYRHFLTPMSDYDSRYLGEIHPTLYNAYKQGKVKELVEDSKKVAQGEMKISASQHSVALPQHIELFQIDDESTVQAYLNAPKPSLETFEQILSTVRQAQGYTEEEAKEDISRVIDLHQMLNEQNPNSPNHFFKPNTK